MSQCGQPLAGTLLATLMMSAVDANQPMSSEAARSALGQTAQITTPLSPLDRQRAETWQISESEWRRYQSLMEGIRGSISPANLSPIEVLGIHARDEAERRRYAERWAQMMRDDADRILAFQHAYDSAWKRLFPAESLIDRGQLPAASASEVELQSHDRVLFFTRPDCAVCDAVLRRLLGKINAVAGIDIYLIGAEPSNDAAVREWANGQAIEPIWVRTRRVTLNHDAGALAELSRGQGRPPYLLRRRGDVLAVLPATAL